MSEENKNLEVQKGGEIKVTTKGFIGLGLIIISILILNSFASNYPSEDESQLFTYILSLPLFLILLTGIILFFLGSKGYERKLILILIILPFIIRIIIGIGFLTPFISIFQAEKVEGVAVDKKNVEKCFEIGETPFVSYFLAPPLVDAYYFETLRDECVIKVAVTAKNASFCEILAPGKFTVHTKSFESYVSSKRDDYRAKCNEESLFISENEKSSFKQCEEFPSGSEVMEECIDYFAVRENNVKMCDMLPYQYQCIAAIDMANRIPDNNPEKCKNTIEEIGKDHSQWNESNCIRALAIRSGNIEICQKIKGLGIQDMCLNQLERFNK
jgi:hypothetical protein